jgi:hypothetical protein
MRNLAAINEKVRCEGESAPGFFFVRWIVASAKNAPKSAFYCASYSD